MDECMKKFSFLLAVMLLSGMAEAQPALHLKGLKRNEARQSFDSPQKTRTPGRSHFLVQFAGNPASAQLAKLSNRGATVLSYVPDFAFSISARDGISLEGLNLQWIGRLHPDEKISPELEGGLTSPIPMAVLVELYADVDPNDGRAIANEVGLRIQDNPDLLANHLLVSGTKEQLLALAAWDEVAYVFPASTDLIHGTPVEACAGALTSQGPVQQAIPLIGEGWDGPGLGAANLNYAFVNMTEKLPARLPWKARLFARFPSGRNMHSSPSLPPRTRTGTRLSRFSLLRDRMEMGIRFKEPPYWPTHSIRFRLNPEPIAGDMHFNDAQSWQIGNRVDLFSVALHETGHALGLGHSDKPGDVMYPYYHMHTGLAPNDISAVLELYAAQAVAPNSNPTPPAPTPPVSPLVLAVIAPPSSSSASYVSISGATSGGSGNVQVSWTTASGTSGIAQGSSNWLIPSILLSTGNNIITITAQDSQKNVVSSSVTISYQPQNAPPANPTPPNPNPPTPPNPPPPPNPPSGNPTPPAGPDTTPPSLTILSPATSTYSTTSSSLVVSGTATDNVGVASVTWASSNGGSGTASATNNWATPSIPLYIGATTIIITAADAAGNTSWRSITVTRN